jgi:hypothetical protein
MTLKTTTKILIARRPATLVRVWRSNGPGTPLVSRWIDSSSRRLDSDAVDMEAGGWRRCA